MPCMIIIGDSCIALCNQGNCISYGDSRVGRCVAFLELSRRLLRAGLVGRGVTPRITLEFSSQGTTGLSYLYCSQLVQSPSSCMAEKRERSSSDGRHHYYFLGFPLPSLFSICLSLLRVSLL